MPCLRSASCGALSTRHVKHHVVFSCVYTGLQLTINYYQMQRGTKRMVDLSFEFNDPCTTIPPVEYGGNENLLADFEEMV